MYGGSVVDQIRREPWHLSAGLGIEVTPTELYVCWRKILCIIVTQEGIVEIATRHVSHIVSEPNALPPERRLEALNTDDAKEQPEEADQKGDVRKQRGGLFQASQYYLIRVSRGSQCQGTDGLNPYRSSRCQRQQSQDSQRAEHLKDVDMPGRDDRGKHEDE